VHGARENNLKDVSFAIPKRRLTVLAGVSGSGRRRCGRRPAPWRSAARRRTTCATSTSTSTSRSGCELLVPPLNPALGGGDRYENNDM
jgi:hypothetical protein